jgi:apolipoprotein N-acyltransferase
MKTFDFIKTTIPHNLKDPHSKILEPDCLSPFASDYDTVSRGGGEIRDLKGCGERLKGNKYLFITAASLLLFTLAYGYLTITTPITGNQIKISLIQGNIEQVKKWDSNFAREIRGIYAELTRQVSKEQPALIIWPETATPESITQNPFYYKEVKELSKNTGIYLLLGSAQHQKFRERGEKKKIKYYNSAFLIAPEVQTQKNQLYNKIRLFPFSEYLPYRETIPWSMIGLDASGSDNYTPGKDFTIFEHPDFRFGATICWENIFPDLVREFVKRGAQLIVNITNEAHFGKTAAPHQLASMSVFRAVENKVYVVRCANTGVSCVIDPNGRIVDRIKDEKGEDIFVRGVLTGWVVPLDSKTIFTRYGDWFVWIATVGSVVFLAIAIAKRKRNLV